jgi:ketosteroid isomerase-like protein
MQNQGTIEARLAALESEARWQRDQIEIRQVIASYGPLVDVSDRLERSRILAQLWTEDGIYDIGGVQSCQGRDAIAKVFEERHFGQVPEGVCHVMGLPHVHIEGDTAVALNYTCVMRPDGDDRFYPWRVSANKWEMVRQDGKWLIHRRTNRLMTGDPDARAMLEHIDQMTPDLSPPG